MRRFQMMLFCFALTATAAGAAQDPQVELFNGQNLSGWHEVGGGKWTVQNGEIVGETGDGRYGWLVCGTEFSDFSLKLQFKPEAPGNAGVQFRSHIIEDEMYGYQAEVDPNYGKFTGGVYEEGKRGWLAKPDMKLDKMLKPNEWNSLTIQAVGDHITTYLNGYKMVDFHDDNAIRGIIALQVHSGKGQPVKIRWKDISIVDLGYGPGWTPLFNGKNLNGWVDHGDEKWYVEDGWIVGQALTDKYGYLATKDKYSNFVLRLKYKADGVGNSGAFFHSYLEGVNITGVQAEIDPTIGNNTGGLYESGHGGRGWIVQPDDLSQKVVRPPGQMNDLVFKVNGNHVISYVNGWKAVDFVDDAQKHTNGVIALQLHSGGQAAMRWRDIYIRVLP